MSVAERTSPGQWPDVPLAGFRHRGKTKMLPPEPVARSGFHPCHLTDKEIACARARGARLCVCVRVSVRL